MGPGLDSQHLKKKNKINWYSVPFLSGNNGLWSSGEGCGDEAAEVVKSTLIKALSYGAGLMGTHIAPNHKPTILEPALRSVSQSCVPCSLCLEQWKDIDRLEISQRRSQSPYSCHWQGARKWKAYHSLLSPIPDSTHAHTHLMCVPTMVYVHRVASTHPDQLA